MSNITVNWILDDANPLFDDLTSLETAITAAGGLIHDVRPRHYYMDEFDHCSDDSCVLYYGSLRIGSKIRHLKPWTPGVFCDFDKLRCTHYYPLLGDQLFNRDYIVVPFMELQRLWPFYSDCFNSEDLFVRPDDGRKGFTGQVVNARELAEFTPAWKDYLHGDGLVIVSHPKPIDREYRFIIMDGEVVAGSLYKRQGQHTESGDIPYAARRYAEDTIKAFQPDIAFVLDIAELPSGDFRVLEINSWSCSGFYAADRDAIVEAAHRLARRLHTEYMEAI